MAPTRHSVSQVLELLQNSLRRGFSTLLVEGEVVDPLLSRNGHFYFRLRDPGGELKAVMWRRDAVRMRSQPQPGDKITARGNLALYPARGELQFVATALMRSGKGQKLAELRELQERLRGEGMLDRPKLALPKRIKNLGLVTSVGGAVLHDIYQTVRRRNPSTELWLSPASVTGPNAATELLQALERLRGLVDVVILARGGGSFEELLPFSDEALVRVVADFPVPILSAVGHGSDVTILDLVADHRADTPTAAAEMCTPMRSELLGEHQRLRERLIQAVQSQVGQARFELLGLARLCRAQHPAGRLARQRDEVKTLLARLKSAGQRRAERSRTELAGLGRLLRSHNPASRVGRQREELGDLQGRLLPALESRLQSHRKELQTLRRACLALGPQTVLERGFAMVTQDGVPLTKVAGRRPGEELELHLADGKMRVTILEVSSPPYD